MDEYRLVHPKETLYFGLAVAYSLLFYLFLILSVVGVVLLIAGALLGLVGHGLFIGRIRGSALWVSEQQFPDLHRMAADLAARMGLGRAPALYVVEGGGLLNAFATRLLRRDFVVVSSDVLAIAYERGEAEVGFVVAHELAHLKRGHLTWRWLLAPALFTPLLGHAYSRMCEHTCDRMAAWHCPEGARTGLLLLAAGGRLYRRVDSRAFAAQGRERGFWIWLAEVLSSHPHLPRRLGMVEEVLSRAPASASVPA